MKYVNLGLTGLKVSRICLGALAFGSSRWREWILDEDSCAPLIQRAFELGINFFDTADSYSFGESEAVLGRAIKNSAIKRENVVIATKIFHPMSEDPNERGLSRKHIIHSIDNSLRRLQTDYVDLYQIHRFDSSTPVEETIEAFKDIVRAGKVLYIGASSMYLWQFAKFVSASEKSAGAKFVTMQNHYNLIYREEEREMIPYCLDKGIGLLPWGPLARGFLAGKQRDAGNKATLRARTDEWAHKNYNLSADYEVAARVQKVANELGISRAVVALAWLLKQPGIVAPIFGATKISQLEEAVEATELCLDDAHIKMLGEDYRPHPIIGHE